MKACPKQLFFFKVILNPFVESIGLHVNYHKSNVYPINVSYMKMDILAKTFHCQIGTFPFTYMGLPIYGINQTKLGSNPTTSPKDWKMSITNFTVLVPS